MAMSLPLRPLAAAVAAVLATGAATAASPDTSAPPPPGLTYAFTAHVQIAAPVEQGSVDGGRQRFIAITGGTIEGPRLNGTILPGGGDWQTILPGGLTQVVARYFIRADDGTVIAIDNPGVRVASAAVTEQLARNEPVDPSAYYFRTTPRFTVTAGPHEWMRRTVFVARGIRRPTEVVIHFYAAD
jgi:hypothetical protein